MAMGCALPHAIPRLVGSTVGWLWTLNCGRAGPQWMSSRSKCDRVQEGKHFISGTQDFKDLETASSSGSTHAPGKPSVFPSLSNLLCRARCHQFNTHGIQVVCQETFFDDPRFQASDATSFPTHAQAERSKAAAWVFTSVLTPKDPLLIDERPSVAQTHSNAPSRFARRLQTVELPPPVEEVCPRKSMVEMSKHNSSELQFVKFPNAVKFLLLEHELQD